MMSRWILLAIGVACVVAPGCSSFSKRSYVQGLTPTPADYPIRIYAEDEEPVCQYVPIGKVSVSELDVEALEDSTLDRSRAYAEIRRLAREMGGHAILLGTLDERRARRVPEPRSIDDLVPESRDEHPLAGGGTDELDGGAAPPPEPARDVDLEGDASVGLSVGRSGVLIGTGELDRLSFSGIVIYFVDDGCAY